MTNRNAGCDPQPKFIDNAKLLDGNSTYAHGSYPVKGFTRVVTYTGGKFFTPGGIFAKYLLPKLPTDCHRLIFDEII